MRVGRVHLLLLRITAAVPRTPVGKLNLLLLRIKAAARAAVGKLSLLRAGIMNLP
jgi:hypothetical protein